jgi:methionyl-tRNA synthetase
VSDPFYITTAIAYPNGPPHIGHMYELVATDAIARFHRLEGRDVRFLTGTDEHGQKMLQTARANGLSAREQADRLSQLFRDMGQRFNASNDDFIRTTEPRHYGACQALWQAMEARGDIYLDRYEGWYSTRDEAYYDDSELVTADSGEKLSPQGTPVEWTVEESYFFRLSAYADKLLAHFEAHPEFIRPEGARSEMMNFVRGGLRDLSISRTSFDWGIPAPDKPGHVMYVWLDALTNYITALGYPDVGDPLYQRYWLSGGPLHIIGKDITRFHTLYWPAFLMSAGVPLPARVFAHGFLFNRGEKMSKSLGNVVSPESLAAAYGVDAVRYYFLREVPFGQDGSYSEEAIVARVNADLANAFGNLIQRTVSFIVKNLDGVLPTPAPTADDTALRDEMAGFAQEYRSHMAALDLSFGIEAWLRACYACNQYIDTQAPWSLRKTDPARMEAVLATLLLCIRDLAILIQPIIPASAAKVLDLFGIPASERSFAALDDAGWYERQRSAGFRLQAPTPLFPKLELAKPDAD